MKPEDEETIRNKALRKMRSSSNDATMRNTVSEAMLGVLKDCEFRKVEDIVIPDDINQWIVELCMVAVRLRTRVKRDGYRQENISHPGGT